MLSLCLQLCTILFQYLNAIFYNASFLYFSDTFCKTHFLLVVNGNQYHRNVETVERKDY